MNGRVEVYHWQIEGEDVWARVHFEHWLPRHIPGGTVWAITWGHDIYASQSFLSAVVLAEEVQHVRQMCRYGRRLGTRLRNLAFLAYYVRDVVRFIPYARIWAEREAKTWALANVTLFRNVP